jgi:hypothetical protein
MAVVVAASLGKEIAILALFQGVSFELEQRDRVGSA